MSQLEGAMGPGHTVIGPALSPCPASLRREFAHWGKRRSRFATEAGGRMGRQRSMRRFDECNMWLDFAGTTADLFGPPRGLELPIVSERRTVMVEAWLWQSR